MTTHSTVRVIKVGGRVQGDPALIDAIVRALRAHPNDALCIVHGGGDEISALQRRLGDEPKFVGGRRVTSEADVDTVRMVLSGVSNKRLVAALGAAGLRAVGVSGEDGGLLTATIMEPSLGRVGTPTDVDPSVIRTLFGAGFLPVVAPVAREAEGARGLNVNGDDAAAAIAVALGARELLFVADVAGVLADGALIPTLDVDDAATLIEAGVAAGGMAAKLEAATRALTGGVEVVRIADVTAITDARAGTTLTLSSSAV